MDVRNYKANPQDKHNTANGKFKVITLFPFSRKYWILAVGPNYEWSLIGSPNHKGVWLFSRTPTLGPDVLAQVEARAAAEGFPAARLVMTPQTGSNPPAAE